MKTLLCNFLFSAKRGALITGLMPENHENGFAIKLVIEKQKNTKKRTTSIKFSPKEERIIFSKEPQFIFIESIV